jgi:16S rRNA (cytosine967-C5)-methyltransferase
MAVAPRPTRPDKRREPTRQSRDQTREPTRQTREPAHPAEPPKPKRRTPPGGAGMTPGARLEAAITLLDEIFVSPAAADDIVGSYFRRHRFAGAKDRGAISEHIYAVLRHRAALDWWIMRIGKGIVAGVGRIRLFAALLLLEGWTVDEVMDACDGDRFRPPPLRKDERFVVDGLAGHTVEHPEMPDWVRYNYPDWLDGSLKALFGFKLPGEMAALNGPAALDLRANALKGTRAEALAALTREGVTAEPTPHSPLGLRVRVRIPLATLEVFKSGAVEVQDEASQLAAILADARPGMRVVDFCAGAGGKTLALAAAMGNRGQLVACDISEKRLERSGQRLRRAGVSNVERRALTTERDKWVKRHAETYDRVFVDAPCTGTGTWRRNPDSKWRLKPTDVTELTELQSRILESASRLVKPGGRLVYATCSLLPAENEERIAAFLAAHPDFTLLPVQEVWRDVIGTPCPVAEGEMLRLTPMRHGTDGFFAAILQKAEAPQIEPQQIEQSPQTSAEPA